MKDILLVYGHALSRHMVSDLIQAERAMCLADEAASVNEAITKTRQRKFDVVVLDISGPEKNGLEIFCDFKQASPGTPVLVINGSDQIERIVNFIRLGCDAYLPYTATSEQVIPAIRALSRGQHYAMLNIGDLAEKSRHMPHECLSMRELQILLKLIKGQPVNAVAEELSIAPSSVSVFRSKILKKMHVSNNAALIHYALDHYLTPHQQH